jgi:hypothetical protein
VLSSFFLGPNSSLSFFKNDVFRCVMLYFIHVS